MSIQDKVIRILAEQAMLEPSDISATDTLADLGIDSMGVVESIFAIEEEFDIQVPFNANNPSEGDFDISDVSSIVSGIEKLLAQKT